MLVIAGGRDAIFSPRAARRTARAYHADINLFPDAPHDMILDIAWQPVTDAMLAWLDGRGLELAGQASSLTLTGVLCSL